LGLGYIIVKSIVNPINLVKEQMTKLDAGDMTNLSNGLLGMPRGNLSSKVEKITHQLNINSNDEIGEMANVFDNLLIKAQERIEAYEIVRSKVILLSSELTKLIKDAKDGLLDNRGDIHKFGVYQELINGLNQTLDAIIFPLQDGAKVWR
jgi:methyl-accepting chemotaxis protein